MEDFIEDVRKHLDYKPKTLKERTWLRQFYIDVSNFVVNRKRYKDKENVPLAVLKCIDQLWNSASLKSSIKSLPLNFKIVSVDWLISRLNNISTCNLVSNLKDDVAQHIPCVKCLLLGHLTVQPQKGCWLSVETTGTIFLEDNTAAIPLEFVRCKKNWLDQLVVLPSWNYVPINDAHLLSLLQAGRGKSNIVTAGYIEVLSDCIPVFGMKIHDQKQTPSLSLLEFSRTKGRVKRELCTIRGQVTALSPIHSTPSRKPFFLVRLSCHKANLSTFLVFQGEYHMHKYNLLHIDEEYIVTDVKETAMNKNTEEERTIIAATSRTQVLTCATSDDESQEAQVDHHLIMPRNRKRKQQESAENQPENKKSRTAKNVDDPCWLISYSGEVTAVIKQEAGIYELDNKIRLYLCFQPFPNMARGIRQGVKIALHNVHLCKRSKKILGLFCCTLSSLKIVEFSKLSSPWKPYLPCCSPIILCGHDLPVSDYIQFVEVCDQLTTKFYKKIRSSQLVSCAYSRECREKPHSGDPSLAEQLLSSAKLESHNSLPERRIYQEFFNDPHTCSPSLPGSLSFPLIPTISELHEKINERAGLTVQGNKSGFDKFENAAGSKEWEYRIMKQEELFSGSTVILLGILEADGKNGDLQLCDRTGTIVCHVARDHQDCSDHQCNTSCGLDGMKEDRPFSAGAGCGGTHCPFLDTWHIGALLKVNKFQVVVEQFPKNFEVGNSSSSLIYIQLSMKDADILLASHLVKCSSRESLQIHERNKMDEKQSNLASSDVEAENPPPRRKSIFAFLFLVRHVENSIFQKSSEHGYIYKSGVDVTIIGCHNQQEQLPHNVDSRKDISAHSLVVTDFQTITKSAQLKLEGSFVYLREVLHPGCLYILSEMYSELRDSILLKARNTLNLKPIVTVTSSMNLIRVSEHGTTLSLTNKESVALSASTPLERAIDGARTSFMRNCPLETVEQALSDINTRKSHERGRSANTGLVNFRGVIVQREYRKSNVCLQQLPNGLVDIPRFGPAKLGDLEAMNLGFCLIGNQTIVLKIQDVDSMNSVMVYLDLSRTSYIRGLIPGAVIQFRRLQKKYSQKGNAYCRFDVCSSLKVEQVAPARDSESSESGPFLGPKTQGIGTDTKRSPNANIIDLIRYGSRGRLIQIIVRVRCRVTNVQWAMLQWTCCKCGHSVIKEECSAACGMSSGYKFNAELRCLIEDGTGEAQLYLYDELVPLLLKLTSQGWSRLQSLVMNTGKVEYQRNSYGGRPKAMRSGGKLLSRHSEAKSTLEENCQSPVVRRLLNMHCKHFRLTSNRGEASAQNGGTGFDSRSIIIGAMEHKTLTLPKLYLKAVAIDDVDCVQEIKCLLKWNYSPPGASDF